MYYTVKIKKDALIELLIDRLEMYTNDEQVITLYQKYYSGLNWDGRCLDVMEVVDNDWFNYTKIISEGDGEAWELAIKNYKDGFDGFSHPDLESGQFLAISDDEKMILYQYA